MMGLGWWWFGVVGRNFRKVYFRKFGVRDEVRIAWFGCFEGECTTGLYG